MTVIDGATDAVITTVNTGLGVGIAIAVNQATNKIYVTNEFVDLVRVIDGATNTFSNVAGTGDGPTAVAVNPLTNTVYVANRNGADVDVITEVDVQAIPLTLAIGALAHHVSASPTPTFALTSGGTLTARQVYYQLDTLTGPWLPATGTAPAVTVVTAPLALGPHVLYAFAVDGQDATSVNTGKHSARSWGPSPPTRSR